jgi:BCL2-associated athanogene 3
MSAQNHQEQAHHPQHSDHSSQQSSNVRHIPIFVEGRDEPVINKNVNHGAHYESKPSYAPPPQQQQPHIEREQYFPDEPVFHPPPNFSRAFGTPFNKGFRQGPQPFVQQKVYPQTAFTRGASPQRSQSPKPQMHPEEHFVKMPVHHEHAPKPEPPRPQQKPAPQQQQSQQQQPQHQHQQAPPKQDSPPPQAKPQQIPSNDPITQILSIQTDVLNLMTEVENFTGSKKDKNYLFLDEMLTRNLIKLDNIETDGKENIRQARKEAIRCIQKCIAVLEAKADKGTTQLQDVDMQNNAEAGHGTENGVEVENKEQANGEAKVEGYEPSTPVPEKQNETNVQEATEPEVKPETADTRPDEKAPEQTTESNVEKKDQDGVDKKVTPKKGTKNIKKRDKSKDKKETKDSNKEEAAEKEAVMQIDDKGDKTTTQAMEVDGAASQ